MGLTLFYMLQCVVAFIVAWQSKDLPKRSIRLVTFSFLAIMCLLVFALEPFPYCHRRYWLVGAAVLLLRHINRGHESAKFAVGVPSE